MKEIIRENEFSVVSYDKENHLLEIYWKKKLLTSEEYREIWKEASKVKFKYFLSDAKNQGLVKPDDRKWFQEKMIPQAVKNGLKTAAVVIADNPFKKYYMNMIFKVIKISGVKMKIFTEYNKAREWILENKNN